MMMIGIVVIGAVGDAPTPAAGWGRGVFSGKHRNHSRRQTEIGTHRGADQSGSRA